jgi:hypothetical protein
MNFYIFNFLFYQEQSRKVLYGGDGAHFSVKK